MVKWSALQRYTPVRGRVGLRVNSILCSPGESSPEYRDDREEGVYEDTMSYHVLSCTSQRNEYVLDVATSSPVRAILYTLGCDMYE